MEFVIKAKPIEWLNKEVKTGDWYESRYGFWISLNQDAEYPYHAAWGEGDEDCFTSPEEAQRWCQDTIDTWVRENTILEKIPEAQAVVDEVEGKL